MLPKTSDNNNNNTYNKKYNMDDILKIFSAFKIRRNRAVRQYKNCILRKRKIIIQQWFETIGKLNASFNRTLEIYLPRHRSLKAHYRAPDVGNDLLNKLNDKRFCQEFRISRLNFNYICNALRQDLEPKPNPISGRQKQATVEEKVAVCLHRLKSCSEYQVTGNVFGFGKSTVSKYFHEVIRAIIKRLTPKHIKMPNSEEVQVISTELARITKIKNILGAIDCTHIPVTAPLEGSRDFLNRKGWTSIVLQAVVDHDYRFLNISCKFPGNVHDAVVLKGSELFQRHVQIFPTSDYFIGDINIPYFLLGDPAYPLLPWIMKDFPGANLDSRKQIFNENLNRGRVKVEQTFGIFKKMWRILSRRSEIDVSFMPLVVAACCTLHNIIRDELVIHSDQIINNINSPNNSNVMELQLMEVPLPAAEAIRNAIADILFQDNAI